MTPLPFHAHVTAIQRDVNTALASITDEQLEEFVGLLLEARRIFVAGRGRTGLIMRGFAMRLMHLGLTAHVVEDVTTPAIEAADVLVIGSGSGQTPSVLQYALRAKQEGAEIALLTAAAEGSPIGEQAKTRLRFVTPTVKTGETGGLALPMASVFELAMMIFLEIVIVRLMERLGVDEASMMRRHANLE